MPRRAHVIAKAVGVAVDRNDKLWTSVRSAPVPEINYLSAAEVPNSGYFQPLGDMPPTQSLLRRRSSHRSAAREVLNSGYFQPLADMPP
jgi:hypothetical protein